MQKSFSLLVFLTCSVFSTHAIQVFPGWDRLGAPPPHPSGEPPQSVDVTGPECREVHHHNISYQCEFVRSNEDCQFNEGFINYIAFVYCMFNEQLLPLSMTLLILLWAFLFLLLAITADDFFCPSLVVIKDTLRLSDNIAGVTLLAFGNGAPDVFSAISAVKGSKGGDMGLVFGALLGAGVFLTTVVTGSVCCVKPFHAAERPFLRDVIFYLGTAYFVFCVIYYGTINLVEASLFLTIYGVYVIVVLGGRFIYQRTKRNQQQALQDVCTQQNGDGANVPTSETESGDTSENDSSRKTSDLMAKKKDSEQTPLMGASSVSACSCSCVWSSLCLQLKDLAFALSPIHHWSDKSCLGKTLAVYKIPGVLILRLALPVVDEDRPNNNWSRPLNSLQCFIAPTVAIFLASTDAAFYSLGGLPVWSLIMIIGCVLGLIVFLTSTNEEPPKYHWVFAFCGFVLAVIWIQAIANEIVNILRTFGMVMSISDAILGLTLLAWGNSIGDLVADTTMARQDRSRIGISASFGGPLFNTLVGVGLPFTLATFYAKGNRVRIDRTPLLFVLVGGVFMSLVTSLIVAPLMRFKLNKYYGFLLFSVYAVFLLVALLTETGVINFGPF